MDANKKTPSTTDVLDYDLEVHTQVEMSADLSTNVPILEKNSSPAADIAMEHSGEERLLQEDTGSKSSEHLGMGLYSSGH